MITAKKSIAKGLETTVNLIEEIESAVYHERGTISRIIRPFIADVLGYDLSKDVAEEVSVGDRKGKNIVDIALSMGLKEKHHIFFEVKSYTCKNHELNAGFSQLKDYVSLTESPVSFGILTNGKQVRLYTDAEKERQLDPEPYGVFDLTKDDFHKNKDAIIRCLLPLHKCKWDRNESRDKAHHIYRLNKIKKRLENPSDELLNYVCQDFMGTTADKKREMYREVMAHLTNVPSQRGESYKPPEESGSNEAGATKQPPSLNAKRNSLKTGIHTLRASYVTCAHKNRTLTFNKSACIDFLKTLDINPDQKDSVESLFIGLEADSHLNRIYFKLYRFEVTRITTQKIGMPWVKKPWGNDRARINLTNEFEYFFKSNKINNKSGIKINLYYDQSRGQYYVGV